MILKKETEVIVNKQPIGYIDNGDYSLKIMYKLFGHIIIFKKIKK